MATEFRLPELGENIAAGDVLKVLVSVGDVIQADQPVLELETDKATIEVPSPVGGTVKSVHVKTGEKLQVGGLILTIASGAEVAAAKPEPESAAKATPAPLTAAKSAPAPASVSVVPAAKSGPKATPAPAVAPPPARIAAPAAAPPPSAASSAPDLPRPTAPASPSVRRLARELGVDIYEVSGTGPDGRITDEDLRAFVRERLQRPTPEAATAGGITPAAVPLPDFSKWGVIDRQPMKSVRRKTAQHLARAWNTIPHVTQYDKADITELEQLRKKLEPKVVAMGAKLSMTAIAVRVIASALNVYPQFAASVDMAREEIVFKKYTHIGVAVDTDRGLIVPVLRDADHKNILQLAVELAQLAERTRNRKVTLEEMEGSVFTISNLGGIGGTAFSPIVNSPEVAILGMARSRVEPVFINGLFQPRLMLPLSLSYDHRLIDGADAARFLRWVVEALEQPFLLPFEG